MREIQQAQQVTPSLDLLKIGIRKGDKVIIGNRKRIRVIECVSFSPLQQPVSSSLPTQSGDHAAKKSQWFPTRIGKSVQLLCSTPLDQPSLSCESNVINLEDSFDPASNCISQQKSRLHYDPRRQLEVSNILGKLKSQPESRLNLILDLDETLLSSVLVNDETYHKIRHLKETRSPNIISTFYNSSTITTSSVVNADEPQKELLTAFRPHLREFLLDMSRFFQICVYSHGRKDYVMKLLDKIDPNHEIFNPNLVFKNDGQVNTKTQKDIRSLFPGSTQTAINNIIKQSIIVDDLYEVWVEETHRNVVPVKRFQPFFDMLAKSNPCVVHINYDPYTSIKFTKAQTDLFQDIDIFDATSSQYLKQLARFLCSVAIRYYKNKEKNPDEDVRSSLIAIRKSVMEDISLSLSILEESPIDDAIDIIRFMASQMGMKTNDQTCKYYIVRKDMLSSKQIQIETLMSRKRDVQLIDIKWIIDSFFLVQKQDITKYHIALPLRKMQ